MKGLFTITPHCAYTYPSRQCLCLTPARVTTFFSFLPRWRLLISCVKVHLLSPLGSFPFPSDLGELLFYFLSVPCPWPSRRSITGCKKQTYSFMSLSRLEAPGGRGCVCSAKGAQYVNKWIKPLSPPLPTHQQAHHWVRLEVWKFSFVRLYHPWSLMPWNVATCSSTWLSLQVCGLLEGCGYVSFVLNSLVHSPGHACYTIHAPHTHTHTCSFCFIFSY